MVCGIPDNSVKVNDSVESATVTNPSIDSQTSPFPFRIGVHLDGAVRCAKRRDSGSEDRNAKRVHTSNDLLVRLDYAIANDLLRRWSRRFDTDIVDPLKDHGVSDAGLREDIAVNAADCVRSVAICEDAVSSCGLVHDCNIGCCDVGLHAAENQVRPASVAISDTFAAIGDAIANDAECASSRRGPRFYCRDEEPVSRALFCGISDGKIGGSDLVAKGVPSCRSTAWVAGNVVGGLSVLEVDGNGEL